jgi:hypothetical protein
MSFSEEFRSVTCPVCSASAVAHFSPWTPRSPAGMRGFVELDCPNGCGDAAGPHAAMMGSMFDAQA